MLLLQQSTYDTVVVLTLTRIIKSVVRTGSSHSQVERVKEFVGY